uniref:Uncharacterized protein n=1 Tax=Palpitomonas bilix TaxID=652834 RepID=A0A7S3GGT5_9EUKA
MGGGGHSGNNSDDEWMVFEEELNQLGSSGEKGERRKVEKEEVGKGSSSHPRASDAESVTSIVDESTLDEGGAGEREKEKEEKVEREEVKDGDQNKVAAPMQEKKEERKEEKKGAEMAPPSPYRPSPSVSTAAIPNAYLHHAQSADEKKKEEEEKVRKLVELTGKGEEDCRRLLQRHEWELEESAAAYYREEEEKQEVSSRSHAQPRERRDSDQFKENLKKVKEKAERVGQKFGNFVNEAAGELGVRDAVNTINDEISTAFKEIGRGFTSFFGGGGAKKEEEKKKQRRAPDGYPSHLQQATDDFHKLFPEVTQSESVLEAFTGKLVQKYTAVGNALTPDRYFVFACNIYVSEEHFGIFARVDDKNRTRTIHPLASLSSVQSTQLPSGMEQLELKMATDETYIFRFDDIGSLRGCHGLLYGILMSRREKMNAHPAQ